MITASTIVLVALGAAMVVGSCDQKCLSHAPNKPAQTTQADCEIDKLGQWHCCENGLLYDGGCAE
jgi:hypothetical protein